MIWGSIFGLCFLIEFVWRRGYALWLAMIAGGLAFVLPQASWEIQLTVFGGLSIFAVTLWHFYYHRLLQYWEIYPAERKARNYLHRTFCLTQNIKQGNGRELIDDSIWHVKSEQDLPAGTSVTVNKVQGVFLHVSAS